MNPLIPRNRSFSSFGLIAVPEIQRFGTPESESCLNDHLPPAKLPTTAPRPNGAPMFWHGPHHAASARVPEYATDVNVWFAAPSVNSFAHSSPDAMA